MVFYHFDHNYYRLYTKDHTLAIALTAVLFQSSRRSLEKQPGLLVLINCPGVYKLVGDRWKIVKH